MRTLLFSLLLIGCAHTATAPAPAPATPAAPPAEPEAPEADDEADYEARQMIDDVLAEEAAYEAARCASGCIGSGPRPAPAWTSWMRVPAAAIAPAAGNDPPAPSWEALAEIEDASDRRATVAVELCLDETGGVVHASFDEISGSETWADQIAHWVTTPAYRPYEVAGVAEPVCTQLVFEHHAP